MDQDQGASCDNCKWGGECIRQQQENPGYCEDHEGSRKWRKRPLGRTTQQPGLYQQRSRTRRRSPAHQTQGHTGAGRTQRPEEQKAGRINMAFSRKTTSI